MAGIFSRDRIDIAQDLNSPHRHIAQITDWRSD